MNPSIPISANGHDKLIYPLVEQLRPAQRKAARATRTTSPRSAPSEGCPSELHRGAQNRTRDKARSRMDPEARQVRKSKHPWGAQLPVRERCKFRSAPRRGEVMNSLRSAEAELGTCAWDRRGCQRRLRASRRLTESVPIARSRARPRRPTRTNTAGLRRSTPSMTTDLEGESRWNARCSLFTLILTTDMTNSDKIGICGTGTDWFASLACFYFDLRVYLVLSRT